MAGAACHEGPTIALRTVTLNVPAACAADGGAYATYYGLGDFEPATPAAGHFVSAAGAPLTEIDPRAQMVVVQASEGFEAGIGQSTWTGVAGVPPSGDVNVLLLPQLASCALTGDVGASRTGAVLAPFAPGKVLLVGGTGSPTPKTYVADLTMGTIAGVSPGLLTVRTHASVTAFGSGALVAGGVDPDQVVQQTAEIYDPSLGGFDQQKALMLGSQRSEQGAVVLATGETLLVGGVGGDGTTVLGTMEVIDPATRVVRAEGVARLTVPRRDPTVLLLASGEILVAGGYDASGAPVPTLEWFRPDASQASKVSQDLGAIGGAQAFGALQGGGALAIVAPPPSAPASFPSVWQISANGAPQAANPVEGTLTAPVLFGGAQGAPVLWTGDRWLRWQPWTRSFGALEVLDPSPGAIGDTACTPDPGLAMWLDPGARLRLLRFDTRNAYSTLPADLLVSGPGEMAPDRLALGGVVAFDTQSSEGELDLGPGDAAFVTDRTYGDVAIDVTMPTTLPALVVLQAATGESVEVGGLSCPASLGTGPLDLHVERRGSTVTWSTPGGASGACTAAFDAGARISIGLRGPAGSAPSAARDLRVRRL